MCFSLPRRAIFPHLTFKKWSVPLSFLTFWLANVLLATAACNFSTSHLQKAAPEVFCTFWLQNVLLATAGCNFSTSHLQKAVPPWGVLYILSSKCASRYAACNFLTSHLQKAVRPWGVLYILTSKCASRYSGVQFFHIATSKSGPRMLCFVHFYLKMCFSLQRRAIFHFRAPHPPLYRGYFSTQPTRKSLKNTAFRDFPNISRLCSFYWLSRNCIFFLLTLLLFSAFSSSDFATLFFNCPYCRKLDF